MIYDKKIELLEDLKEKINKLNFNDNVELKVIRTKMNLVFKEFFSYHDCEKYEKEIENVNFYPVGFFGDRDYGYELKCWESGKKSLLAIVFSVQERIQFENEMSLDLDSKITDLKDYVVTDIPPDSSPSNNKVFIVHGRDDAMKLTVKDFLKSIGLEPIILHEQVDTNQTVIEKFVEESGDVSFAVVLFSPDDEGGLKGEGNLRSRARQNVILEYGYFIGALGRKNVFTLLKDPQLELPNDINGVIYTDYASADWKWSLMRTLKTRGYEIDANALI